MAQQQQTVLRVQTNIPSGIQYTGSTSISLTGNNVTFGGTGIETDPYSGSTTSNIFNSTMVVADGNGTFYYDLDLQPYLGGSQNLYDWYKVTCYVTKGLTGTIDGMGGFTEYGIQRITGNFKVEQGDTIYITGGLGIPSGSTFVYYVIPDNETLNNTVNSYDTLDLYGDIPLKLNKSFAEIQDIGKRNSDYSVGLSLPGSKKNNAFFENYFNVDMNSLFYDVTRRVNIDVLLNDEVYFKGYMRLNKVSVMNSKVEYDVTLYSTVADLYGQMGNNLLKDLDYDDTSWHFNHYFNVYNVASTWFYNTLQQQSVVPSLWMYPTVHNGYEYTGDTVNVSGATSGSTRLYTSTVTGNYSNYAAFTAAGGLDYRINSPKNPILDNQLKPGLNIYGLLQLLFKTYGYNIKSSFFETPWFKLLYMYGFYSYDGTKFGFKTPPAELVPLDGVDVIMVEEYNTVPVICDGQTYNSNERTVNVYVVKKGTGIPCLCSQQITVVLDFEEIGCLNDYNYTTRILNIPKGTTGTTYSWAADTIVECGQYGCQPEYDNYLGFNDSQSNVDLSNKTLAYFPKEPNSSNVFNDGDYVNFSLVIDTNIKQIDLLSSIAKKFNLVLIPDPDVPNQMIIEPYDYYIGTGKIIDWTDKLSFDKGFTVQPALNFIESELIFTDQEDGDEANKIYKDKNKLIYGENRVYNPTDFKSSTKKIDTIFSPEVIRKWDDRIGIPLGINYAGQSNSQSTGNSEKVIWKYTGLKSKPKLFFNTGNLSPFLDTLGESYDFAGTNVNTTFFRLQPSTGINPQFSEFAIGSLVNPVVSHTMPIGNIDSNKINNDSICILFNSQEPDDIGLGIPTYKAYTDNDTYQLFYSNRVNNLYDKNTRFLDGNFNLKLSDVKNLSPKDIIKIQEQYFYVNKLEGFDLTNPELTKVQLTQTNITPQTYPTRYFKYEYCNDSLNRTFKFRTFFDPLENTNGVEYLDEPLSSIRRTYYYWSILYDYMVGVLGGEVSNYTSSYNDPLNGKVWSYTITEITESEYNDPDYLFWYDDSNNKLFVDRTSYNPTLSQTTNSQLIWVFSNQAGQNKAFFNLGADCSNFNNNAVLNGVTLSPAPGSTPTTTYTSGITINVTDTGWIKYDTVSGTVYKQITTVGNYDIPGCANCSTVTQGIPFADLASFTIVDCGTPC